jgi:hypothetical protein
MCQLTLNQTDTPTFCFNDSLYCLVSFLLISALIFLFFPSAFVFDLFLFF